MEKDKKPEHFTELRELLLQEISNIKDFFSDKQIDEFIVRNHDKIMELTDKGWMPAILTAELFEEELVDIRRCSSCGELFKNGFVIDGGTYYACSDECLDDIYQGTYGSKSLEETKKMYLCDYYYIDYNYVRDKIEDMHDMTDVNEYLSSLPDADEENSQTYYTEF